MATFLGVPVDGEQPAVHGARAAQAEELTMVKDTLDPIPSPTTSPPHRALVRARERVIEARFDPSALPGVLTELTVSDDAGQRAISVQVIQRLPDGVVRAVATTPTEGFAPGMSVLSEGRHVQTPLNRVGFERDRPAPGRPHARWGRGARLLETGIKVVDVMCPLVAGGTVTVAGEFRAGTLVVVEELARRLGAGNDRLSIFALVPGPMTTSFEAVWEKEGYSGGTVGPLQTFYFLREEGPWTGEEISALRGVDSVIRLSTALAQLGDLPRRWIPSARAHGSSTRGWSSASTSRSRRAPVRRWPCSIFRPITHRLSRRSGCGRGRASFSASSPSPSSWPSPTPSGRGSMSPAPRRFAGAAPFSTERSTPCRSRRSTSPARWTMCSRPPPRGPRRARGAVTRSARMSRRPDVRR